MKKIVLFLLGLALSLPAVSAQDIITMKDGSDIRAKVLEIGAREIRYVDFDNLDGPVYVLKKSEVFRIVYQNGKSELFGTDSAPASVHVATPLSGVMTLNRRTGKLSIDGMDIDKRKAGDFFDAATNELYQRGDILSSVGQIMWICGVSFAVGYTIPVLISGDGSRVNTTVYVVCAGLVAVGVPLELAGLGKIRRAIAVYNTKHNLTSYTPELSFGLQANGVGFALQF